jgi:hypothetical protein
MVMWEYTTVGGVYGEVPVERLNSLGADGWELVAVTLDPETLKVVGYFKRLIKQ